MKNQPFHPPVGPAVQSSVQPAVLSAVNPGTGGGGGVVKNLVDISGSAQLVGGGANYTYFSGTEWRGEPFGIDPAQGIAPIPVRVTRENGLGPLDFRLIAKPKPGDTGEWLISEGDVNLHSFADGQTEIVVNCTLATVVAAVIFHNSNTPPGPEIDTLGFDNPVSMSKTGIPLIIELRSDPGDTLLDSFEMVFAVAGQDLTVNNGSGDIWNYNVTWKEVQLDVPASLPVDEFVFTVDTTQTGSASDTFILPTALTGTFNCVVDWGDGTQDTITSRTAPEWTHVFPAPGTYTITIGGEFGGIRFGNGGDRRKMGMIMHWGTTNLASLTSAFHGCSNMDIHPAAGLDSDLSTVIDMSNAFNACSSLTNFPFVDTSNVTDMTSAFRTCGNLTGEFPLIDTSKVTSFSSTFNGCSDLADFPAFDLTSATTMANMFQNCSSLLEGPVFQGSNAGPIIGTNFFFGCQSLASLPAYNVTLFSLATGFFRSTGSLLTVPNLNFSGITSANSMFQAGGLTHIPLLGYNNVTSMSSTFNGTDVVSIETGFGLELGNVTTMTNCMLGCTVNEADYNQFLVELESVNQNAGVSFHGGDSVATGPGLTARQALIDDHGWSITDGTPAVADVSMLYGQTGDPKDTGLQAPVVNGDVAYEIKIAEHSSESEEPILKIYEGVLEQSQTVVDQLIVILEELVGVASAMQDNYDVIVTPDPGYSVRDFVVHYSEMNTNTTVTGLGVPDPC